MKNVLLLLHDDEGQEARLQVALDLARAVSGHLTCLDVTLPPAFAADYFTGAGDATVMAYLREREAGNRSAVEARLSQEDVPWTMLEAIGAPGPELKDASDLADVIVISGGSEASPEARHLAGQVAVNSDRLVLAVPPGCVGFAATGKALVAWDGSRGAADALREAMPLLRQAASVTLMSVNQPAGTSTIADAAAYLSRHGVEPRVVEKASEGKVANAIVAEARAIGAAYVVLGAFGLPRALETVFGGVTDGMLHESPCPLLLAH